jgi:pimeloyl-ACP methyl ester carboxylesterase
MNILAFTIALLISSPPSQPLTSQAGDSATSEPVALPTPTGPVLGTLLRPSSAGRAKIPVVLIISGSGPTDRDGNTPMLAGKASPLKLLAEALADNGIASVRYDKRGIAASKAVVHDFSALTFDDYVNDAAAWIVKLQSDPRFSRVIVAGHSEGALIGTIAAARFSNVELISLDGAGDPAALALKAQFASAPKELAAKADSILSVLESGHKVDSVPGPLRPYFDSTVQGYEISWFKYDPAHEIAKLKQPVLIVQGSNDAQISVAQAHRLAAAAGSNARLVVIDSMTHELKLAGSDQASQMRTYTDPTLPISPVLVKEIVAFILPEQKQQVTRHE